MTTKCLATTAHDSAREEDRRRALSELHAYIDGLERQLRETLESARLSDDHARSRQRTVDDLAYRCSAAERDRDAARLALRTVRDNLRCGEGDPAEVADRMWNQLRVRGEVADHTRATLTETIARVEREAVREAQEEGARWVIEEWWFKGIGDAVPSLPGEFPTSAAKCAARICAERRAKGGE